MLSQITIPVMGMFGKRDVIVHPTQWQPLLKGAHHVQIAPLKTPAILSCWMHHANSRKA
jgi:hypothetical protein